MQYADKHMAVIDQALAQGEVDVARKGLEWGMTNISARNEKGERETIIDREVESGSAPTIQIGIALGGLPSSPSTALARK